MFKVFTLGVFLGLGGTIALLYTVPAVDLDREASRVSVQPNGGTREQFRVMLPADRLMAGIAGKKGFPEGLEWPAFMDRDPSQAELFKVRNDNNRVVGVASRLAIGGASPYVEWTLHLPARGTMYLVLEGGADGGERRGRLQGGTREFAALGGAAAERYVAVTDGEPGDGMLELVTSTVGAYVAPAEPVAMAVPGR